MKKTKPVLHINYISVNKFPPTRVVDIYCRRERAVISHNKVECLGCPYFRGMAQGTAIECEWEDEPPAQGDIRHISCGEATAEFLRVARLKDLKILKD